MIEPHTFPGYDYGSEHIAAKWRMTLLASLGWLSQNPSVAQTRQTSGDTLSAWLTTGTQGSKLTLATHCACTNTSTIDQGHAFSASLGLANV